MSRHSARGRPWNRKRRAVLASSTTCWLCGLPGADTVDHVVPRSMGGTDEPWNLRPAHQRCNSRRGTKANVTPSRRSRRW